MSSQPESPDGSSPTLSVPMQNLLGDTADRPTSAQLSAIRRQVLLNYRCPFLEKAACTDQASCPFVHYLDPCTTSDRDLPLVPNFVCINHLVGRCENSRPSDSGRKVQICDHGYHLALEEMIPEVLEDFAVNNSERLFAYIGGGSGGGDRKCQLCAELVHLKRLARNERFAILENCDHCFCGPCIKTMVDSAVEVKVGGDQTVDGGDNTSVTCPECNKKSGRIIFQCNFVSDPGEKKILFEVPLSANASAHSQEIAIAAAPSALPYRRKSITTPTTATERPRDLESCTWRNRHIEPNVDDLLSTSVKCSFIHELLMPESALFEEPKPSDGSKDDWAKDDKNVFWLKLMDESGLTTSGGNDGDDPTCGEMEIVDGTEPATEVATVSATELASPVKTYATALSTGIINSDIADEPSSTVPAALQMKVMNLYLYSGTKETFFTSATVAPQEVATESASESASEPGTELGTEPAAASTILPDATFSSTVLSKLGAISTKLETIPEELEPATDSGLVVDAAILPEQVTSIAASIGTDVVAANTIATEPATFGTEPATKPPPSTTKSSFKSSPVAKRINLLGRQLFGELAKSPELAVKVVEILEKLLFEPEAFGPKLNLMLTNLKAHPLTCVTPPPTPEKLVPEPESTVTTTSIECLDSFSQTKSEHAKEESAGQGTLPYGISKSISITHAQMYEVASTQTEWHFEYAFDMKSDFLMGLGEELYGKVKEHYPDHVGKITGMLMELKLVELWPLMSDEDALKTKMDEAYEVYQNFKDGNKAGSNV